MQANGLLGLVVFFVPTRTCLLKFESLVMPVEDGDGTMSLSSIEVPAGPKEDCPVLEMVDSRPPTDTARDGGLAGDGDGLVSGDLDSSTIRSAASCAAWNNDALGAGGAEEGDDDFEAWTAVGTQMPLSATEDRGMEMVMGDGDGDDDGDGFGCDKRTPWVWSVYNTVSTQVIHIGKHQRAYIALENFTGSRQWC